MGVIGDYMEETWFPMVVLLVGLLLTCTIIGAIIGLPMLLWAGLKLMKAKANFYKKI